MYKPRHFGDFVQIFLERIQSLESQPRLHARLATSGQGLFLNSIGSGCFPLVVKDCCLSHHIMAPFARLAGFGYGCGCGCRRCLYRRVRCEPAPHIVVTPTAPG